MIVRFLTLVVAGSRDLGDGAYAHVSAAIDRWCAEHANGKEVRIVEGGARGADRLAAQYARVRMVPHRQVRALWHVHGRGAGPIRNQQMIDEADGLVVVRFPDSRGSADVLRRARSRGIPVVDVVFERPRTSGGDRG